MIYLTRFFNSKFTQYAIVAYLLVSYAYMALILVSISATSEAPPRDGYLSFSLLAIFIVPFVIPSLYGNEGEWAIWGQRVYKGMYIATLLITVFSGIAWFVYAQSNSYLEPITYLLTLATGAVIYNRDKYIEAIKQSKKLQSEIIS